jgi:hypothetical protein
VKPRSPVLAAEASCEREADAPSVAAGLEGASVAGGADPAAVRPLAGVAAGALLLGRPSVSEAASSLLVLWFSITALRRPRRRQCATYDNKIAWPVEKRHPRALRDAAGGGSGRTCEPRPLVASGIGS